MNRRALAVCLLSPLLPYSSLQTQNYRREFTLLCKMKGKRKPTSGLEPPPAHYEWPAPYSEYHKKWVFCRCFYSPFSVKYPPVTSTIASTADTVSSYC